MKKRWTRRKFLKAGVGGSLIASSRALRGLGQPPVARPSQESEVFGTHERDLLQAAMDEIIPASDGMPAASAVGGVEYFDRLTRSTPGLAQNFRKGLARLAEVSQKRFKQDFLKLSRSERIKVLTELEKEAAPHFFATLRDYVYEAYYTQPQVWKLIGYEFHATNQTGPRMKPFDESVLAQVRKKHKFYREVT